jgi:hypothetical protein
LTTAPAQAFIQQVMTALNKSHRFAEFHMPTVGFETFPPGTYPEKEVFRQPIPKLTVSTLDQSVA